MDKAVGTIVNVILSLILLFLGIWLLTNPKPTNVTIPVCHAITEDSDITDCDYHDGAWWTK